MSNQSEEDAWRSIVENYGERAHLDAGDAEDAAEPEAEGPTAVPAAPTYADPHDQPGPAKAASEEERFVPPPPPPLPHPPPVRLAAWLGLFGSPAVLLVALALGIMLPSWLGYTLLAAFLGGFGYLVAHMQRGPRDPGDDGARL